MFESIYAKTKLRKTKVLINKTKREADVEKEALQAAVRNHNQ